MRPRTAHCAVPSAESADMAPRDSQVNRLATRPESAIWRNSASDR
jgi:hypothetical protein